MLVGTLNSSAKNVNVRKQITRGSCEILAKGVEIRFSKGKKGKYSTEKFLSSARVFLCGPEGFVFQFLHWDM